MSARECFVCIAVGVCFLSIIPTITSLAQDNKADAQKSKVDRGKYLVTTSGCHDCHSPKVYTPEGLPQPDEKRLLCGHPADEGLPEFSHDWVTPGKWVLFNSHLTAAVGPWGISYAANLTPDDQTGIGLWTEDVFIKALRTGKHMGAGRPILPPMPWPNLAEMTDEDLGAMFAYLKSLPPVKNPVPAPVAPPQDE
jgi:mono/diheme cytochrome c family protein